MDKKISWYLKIHLESIRICPEIWTLKQENIKYLKSLKHSLQRLNWIFQIDSCCKTERGFCIWVSYEQKPLFFFKHYSPLARGRHFTSMTQNRKNWAEFSVISSSCTVISSVTATLFSLETFSMKTLHWTLWYTERHEIEMSIAGLYKETGKSIKCF